MDGAIDLCGGSWGLTLSYHWASSAQGESRTGGEVFLNESSLSDEGRDRHHKGKISTGVNNPVNEEE